MLDINHDYTKEIVCPHCGAEHDTTNNHDDQIFEGEMACEACGKGFRYYAHFDVSWVTRKKKE